MNKGPMHKVNMMNVIRELPNRSPHCSATLTTARTSRRRTGRRRFNNPAVGGGGKLGTNYNALVWCEVLGFPLNGGNPFFSTPRTVRMRDGREQTWIEGQRDNWI